MCEVAHAKCEVVNVQSCFAVVGKMPYGIEAARCLDMLAGSDADTEERASRRAASAAAVAPSPPGSFIEAQAVRQRKYSEEKDGEMASDDALGPRP